MINRPIFRYTLVLLTLHLQTLRAEQVNIPVVLDYPVLQQIVINEAFTQPGHSLKYSFSSGSCNSIIFSSPRLKPEGQQLLIRVKTNIRLGFAQGNGCATLINWQGDSELLSKPVLKSDHPLQIFFTAQQVRLYDAQQRPINNTLLTNAIQAQIEPIMQRFKVDLNPAVHLTKSNMFLSLIYMLITSVLCLIFGCSVLGLVAGMSL